MIPRILLLVLAFSASVMTVLPTVSAQTWEAFPTSLQVRVDPLDEPVFPNAGTAVMHGEVEYAYSAPAAVAAAAPTRVALHVVEAPPWATVTLSPRELHFHPNAVGGGPVAASDVQGFEVVVTVTADAPAFSAAPVRIVAEAEPNGLLAPSVARSDLVVQADYFGYLAVVPPEPVPLAAGGSVDVPLHVRNLGNGVTVVDVDLVSVPDGVAAHLPTGLGLESRQTGGRNVEGTLTVGFDASRRFEGGTAVVRLTPQYALDRSIEGKPVDVAIPLGRSSGGNLVEAQAASLAAGPTGLPLLLGLAGAAAGGAVARRSRNASR